MDLSEVWAIFGPGVAGAVFGAGWWFWIDAVVCSSVKISFLHYLPGIFASLAALMFNCVRKEDIDYSPYEEGEWRLKLWLFFAYVVSFVSLAASVGLLIQDSLVKTGPSVWTGTAGVLQCVFVLIRGVGGTVCGVVVPTPLVQIGRLRRCSFNPHRLIFDRWFDPRLRVVRYLAADRRPFGDDMVVRSRGDEEPEVNRA
ncbi:hypothetical protein Ddye_006130 [Dipteronia dyeriana]|uniref:Transmembrane protein 50 homolog n=1 Tax=Dipteronia dyeriana TaxID=168575 RepID=A0AAD9XHZ7_9ROSI|nr:hypothetical protein Ddye_006130 [Dipteronia dyeriana]